ncbi:hypothetical protein GCM10014715_37370 [Streptomyces spiralis]|uniref:Carrier domain-containing protein n=1 Tax=Streptomyces spiralis TaxID=66376 RepID=A0A919DTZ5_9ACTN|nr:phosphopantetheine-binding protein [Streptomyces spiralis]GHE78645.1 hypothetical protein GCM10014715_37370 [Streptomyces spiralis]
MPTDTATLAEVETAVHDITAGALGLSAVGRHDNLLELGVDSLVATRIVAALRTRYGVEIPLILLFEHPEIAEFAESVHDLVLELDLVQSGTED